MMSKKKSSGSISKILKLITVLEKCNGKTSLDNSEALISPKGIKILIVSGLVLLTGALFAVFYLIEPLVAPFITIQGVTQAIMLIILMMSFILSIKNIVTVLYTADDLPVLLPMPLSAGQIATAKLTVASRFPVGLSLIAVNSICFGFGIRAGMGAAYLIGTLLSSVLVPVTGIALATLIVVIVFRLFGFIRNRDITMVLGGVFTLLLTIAYIFISNRYNSGNSEATAAVFSTISSIASGFPNIAFMSSFMFDGNAVGLLLSVGITAVVTALAMLAVKLFYFATALSMQATGTKNKAVHQDALGSRKSNALKALTKYEARMTRRNPAYLIYGFAMSFVWPLIVILPFVFGNSSLTNSLSAPLDTRAAIICALTAAVTASGFACGFNNLPTSAFSREGGTYSALRAMPIRFKDYYSSKRRFSLLIVSLGSILYLLIAGIVCTATGILAVENCWVILYGACVSFLLNLIFIDAMLLKNSKKPVFDWDSETEISRKLSWVNAVAIVIGVVAMIMLFIAIPFSTSLGSPDSSLDLETITTGTAVTAVVVPVVFLILAFAVNKYAVKKAEKNLMNIE